MIIQSELSKKTGIRLAIINEIYNETIERINLEHSSKICEVEDLFQYIPDEEYYKNRVRGI